MVFPIQTIYLRRQRHPTIFAPTQKVYFYFCEAMQFDGWTNGMATLFVTVGLKKCHP